MTILLLATLLTQAPMDVPLRTAERPVLTLREVPYHGGPIPENARVVRRDNDAMFVTGAVVGGLPYLMSLAFGISFGPIIWAFGDDPQWFALVLPVVGPFLAMSLVDPGSSNRNALLVTHGINAGLQTLGVVLMATAALTKSTVLVIDDTEAEVTVGPLPVEGGGGLALRLRY